MSLFGICVELVMYLVCVSVALEYSHRFYWHAHDRVYSSKVPALIRSILSILIALIPLATALMVTFAFNAIFNKLSIESFGLRCDSVWVENIASGAAIALASVMAMFLTGILLGFIRIRRSKLSEGCTACIPHFFGGLTDFFTAAVFEEVIFRGFIFYLLQLAWGPACAVFISSVLFALAHVIRHNETPIIFVLNVIVFGSITGMCRHYTGTLWLPIGLHFGWNIISGPILGLPYAGRAYDNGMVISEVSGPVWLTGGLYSLDAGIFGTIALAVAAVALLGIAPIH